MTRPSEAPADGALAVVLATPPGFNPGMIATELALLGFLRRHGLASQTRFYQVLSMDQQLGYLPPEARRAVVERASTGIAYRSALAEHEQIVRSRAVLFWADFLHMAQYRRTMIRRVASADPYRDADESTLERLLDRALLLAGAEDGVLRHTLSFGTSLLFNTARDEAELRYGSALRRFFGRARRVWVRDVVSAGRVAQLRQDYERGYFGPDCALLLRREDIVCDDARYDGPVLLFLGRDAETAARLRETARCAADALARPLGWLPWGDRHAFPHLGEPGMPAVLPDTARAEELLREVARASLIVTDTYHLAAIAWSFDVPAICAFHGHTSAAADVSSGAEYNWRDKREVFYSQYDALEFLVRPEEVHDDASFARRLRRVLGALSDPSLRRAIVENVRAHANAVEAQLAAELRALLARFEGGAA